MTGQEPSTICDAAVEQSLQSRPRMPARRKDRSPDREIRRLVAGLRLGDEASLVRFYALASDAAQTIGRRYGHTVYRLEGSAADVGQQFVVQLMERRAARGDDYVADIAAAATSIDHLRRILAMRARFWAIDRSRTGELQTRLLRRIKHLPERLGTRFEWAVIHRFLALAGGPVVVRELMRDAVARKLAGSKAGRAAIADYRARRRVGANQLADAVAAVLEDIRGAAAPGPLADVLLLIVGQADTRPALLVGDQRWWDRIAHHDDRPAEELA
jgi:hypothetical protein